MVQIGEAEGRVDRRRSNRPRPGDPFPAGAGSTSRLLERDVLLDEITALVSPEWERPVGAIVLEGYSGVGKSSLFGAACHIAEKAGWLVARARAQPARSGIGHEVLRQLVDSLGTTTGISGTAIVGGSVESGPGALVERLETIARQIPDRRGLFIAVDDARSADAESAEWIARRARALPDRRLRIVLAMAPRPRGAALHPVDQIALDSLTRVMPLAPLSIDATARLGEEYFGRAPEGAFTRACHEVTGGNPFLLVSLFHELSLDRQLPIGSAVPAVLRVDSPTVARKILERMSRMPSEAGRLLDAVAAAGVPVDLELLAEVTGITPRRARSAADDLASIDLITRDRPVRILHPLVRRTLLANMLGPARVKLQLTIARALKRRGAPSEMIADHLLEVDAGGKEWVASVLEEAGELAASDGASTRAVHYFDRAVREGARKRRLPLILTLARAEAPLEPARSLEHLRFAIDEGGATPEAIGASLAIGALFANPIHRDQLAPMFAKLATSGDLEEDTRIIACVAAAIMTRSPDLLQGVIVQLRDIFGARRRPENLSQQSGFALLALAEAGGSRHGGIPQTGRLARIALDGVDLIAAEPPMVELWSRTILSVARADRLDEAIRVVTDAYDFSRSQRRAAAELEYALVWGQLLALQGSLPTAEARLTAALNLAEGQPWARRSDAIGFLIGVLADGGRLTDAEAIATAEESAPSPLDGHHLLEQRGRLRRLQHRWSEACADLQRAGNWAEERGLDNPAVTGWRAEIALALRGMGRDGEARRHAHENLDLARMHGGRSDIGRALQVVALVDPAEHRLELLDEAVRHLDSSPRRLLYADALVELGRALREHGSLERARSALIRGADLAFQCRAASLQASALNELRLSGARPRRPAVTGADALTSSERRVAELAAQGLTNAQIARELYVAEKTIEGHLIRAFRKLGVHSRRQLSEILSSDGAASGLG
jgi:DNA-binding CsgD family transcriptional regulator